jgi:GDP-fucose transporter C1
VLPLTILVSSLNTHTTPAARVILAASIVTLGFLLGVLPSLSKSLGNTDASLSVLTSLTSLSTRITTSPLSLLYGVLSSLFIALHAVYIKSSLPALGNSAIALAWWSNAFGVLFLLPCVLFNGEAVTLMQMVGDGSLWSGSEGRTFLLGSGVTGVVGFLLCLAGLLSIKVTSPITHMFSSAARSVLQTLLGVSLFGDVLTVSRAASIGVIMGGTMYYTWVKSGGPAANANSGANAKPASRGDKELEEGLLRRGSESSGSDVVFEFNEKEEERSRR